ncbi:MAG: ATP-binding cassette domain-containing protein [Acidobacteria bacterium]|nr:ATP-binding cassette domain-containing protein [Acidobacteriota bacterium]
MAGELIARFEKRFPGGPVIEASLSVGLGNPSVTVLFGPSGAGKSTVLRCLAGLERPERGSIRLRDEVWHDSASGLCLAPQRRRIGYLFQEYALFPHLTVRKNVEYGLRLRPARERRERACSMLGRLGIAELEGRYPRQISGGQLQRVALARALAPAPRLLLLDEPLSALDEPTRARLRGELRRLLLASGVPAVLVTHDRAEALELGDRMLVMIDGRIRQAAPPEEVFRAPAGPDVAEALGL